MTSEKKPRQSHNGRAGASAAGTIGTMRRALLVFAALLECQLSFGSEIQDVSDGEPVLLDAVGESAGQCDTVPINTYMAADNKEPHRDWSIPECLSFNDAKAKKHCEARPDEDKCTGSHRGFPARRLISPCVPACTSCCMS